MHKISRLEGEQYTQENDVVENLARQLAKSRTAYQAVKNDPLDLKVA